MVRPRRRIVRSRRVNVTFQIVRLSMYRSAKKALSGIGSLIAGGRWSWDGVMRVLYFSTSLSLAEKELLSNTRDRDILGRYYEYWTKIPKDQIKVLDPRRLPRDWNLGSGNYKTKNIGEKWYREGNYLALQVPSAAVGRSVGSPKEFNIIINMKHPYYSKLRFVRKFHKTSPKDIERREHARAVDRANK
jgi:RES domain-containing protein